MSLFKRCEIGINYDDGKPIREDDIVLWEDEDRKESVVCRVSYHNDKCAFMLEELDGTDREYLDTYMRKGHYSFVSIAEENIPLYKAWSRLGVCSPLYAKRQSFYKQTKPGTCFPIAAINACIGREVLQTMLNFKLLDRMIEVGECEKWRACIDDQLVLNEIQRGTNVQFVQADMESVIEEGGILTVKGRNDLHACAVFIYNKQPYLVNSMIGEGKFVRPLMSINEIPRSDNPEHHRDYLLLVD